jgi:hypothetical protein
MKNLVFFFFMALGLFAQQAKTRSEKYVCISGVPSWDDFPTTARDSEIKAAKKDCAARRKKDMEAFDASTREFASSVKELEKVVSKSDREYQRFVKQICSQRVSFREDGTDDPQCAGYPPLYDNLMERHLACARFPDLLPSCGRLLPLSMAKRPEKTPAKK